MSQLNTTTIGTGDRAIVWCHGIFGQGKNFTRVAKNLVARAPDRWRAILVDLPNHGRSPWTTDMSYPHLADEVAATVADLSQGEPVHLLGHSMGGKVAMRAAVDHPDLLASLSVIDIAPVRAPLTDRFTPMIEAMRSVDLAGLENRRQAEEQMAADVPDPTIRQFLLQNLRHDVHASQGPSWYWQFNLDVIASSMDEVGGWPDTEGRHWDGPVLWMGGQRSDYVRPEYAADMQSLFPHLNRVTVKDAGHWVHADQPEVFTQVLEVFLGQAEKVDAAA